jgi:hypothetical protein
MQISGVVAILVAIVISRIVNERGYRQLTPEEKLRLMDGFSRSRAFSMLPALGIIGAYWLLLTKTAMSRHFLTVAYFGALVVYVVLHGVYNQRKMAQLDLPASYRKNYLLSQAISFAGIAWFFYTLMLEHPR